MNNNQEIQKNIFQFVSRTIDNARNAFINSEDSNYIQTHIDQIERLPIIKLVQLNNKELPIELLIHSELSGGHPKLQIPQNTLVALSHEGYKWTKIAKMLNVIEEIYTILSNDELDHVILSIKEQQPNTEQVIIMGALKESLRRIDPFGITACWAEIISCRRYQVSEPNVLWHIDGIINLDTHRSKSKYWTPIGYPIYLNIGHLSVLIYLYKPNKGRDSGTWDIGTIKKPRDIQNVQYCLLSGGGDKSKTSLGDLNLFIF
ncbi:hypothetical protein Glove_217g263 [Diversispora epigaea]|uniref:Uncharacterized protein n=1 Tax=Diversispora epigaea TaxID=1348612 RepID=A0A397ILU6_9GLOM|nr:hypothetical protein Glove_217g263 [Diversispora epigaea]